jgi:hypothetical protein
MQPLEFLDVQRLPERKAAIAVAPEFAKLLNRHILKSDGPIDGGFEVAYQKRQYPFMPGKPMRENFNYAYGTVLRASVMMPNWSAAAACEEEQPA